MTDEIRDAVARLNLEKRALDKLMSNGEFSTIHGERVESMQRAITAAIAYIEAGAGEMPKEMDGFGLYPDSQWPLGFNAALDACTPIIARLVSERDALQAKLDAVMEMLRELTNQLGGPTMDYAPEIKIKELEARIRIATTAINAAITGEGKGC